MVMTTPILEGTDARLVDGKITGKKMSKSADNYIGVSEPPFEMLQKLMLVDDHVIWRYMDLLSSKSNDEIAQVKADAAAGRAGIIAVKEAFAVEIVTRFHSANDAAEAVARRRNVAKGGLPDAIEEARVNAGDKAGIRLANAMKDTGLAPSTSEALRLIRGGAVYAGEGGLPEEATKDDKFELAKGKRYLLRVGSKNRKFLFITVE
jgi:tyrosyl-tRNA synthetase